MGTHHQTAAQSAIVPPSFYQKSDVVTIAKELLGKFLFTSIDDKLTGGIIIETEAYQGATDRACHAYGFRRTKRTEVMFHEGGCAYVYLCYGIHHLLNFVTHKAGEPHAVLIRALLPTEGIEAMEMRRKKKENLCQGPGALCQALGIDLTLNGHKLDKQPLWVEDRGIIPAKIIATPRIGVAYAKEDALLPYRFVAVLEN